MMVGSSLQGFLIDLNVFRKRIDFLFLQKPLTQDTDVLPSHHFLEYNLANCHQRIICSLPVQPPCLCVLSRCNGCQEVVEDILTERVGIK